MHGVRSSAANPAGLYGPQNGLHAINVIKDGDTLQPLKLPANARVRVFADAKTVALAPWLYMAALLLFLADGAICALFQGSGAIRWRWRRAATAGAENTEFDRGQLTTDDGRKFNFFTF